MAEPTAEEIAAAEAAKVKADADKAEADAKALADAEAAKAKEVTLRQGELDGIAGKARQAGRDAAEKDLLAKLGVADIDAATAIIAANKAAEDAQKTELQKAIERAESAEKEREAATKSATTILAVTRVEGSLRDAGVKPERLASALKLVDLSLVKVDGTDVSGVAEVVESVKAMSPEWFGPAKPGGAPDASGGRLPVTDFRSATKEELDRELYEKYGVRT